MNSTAVLLKVSVRHTPSPKQQKQQQRHATHLLRELFEGPPVVLAQLLRAAELPGVVPAEGKQALRREHQGVLGPARRRHRVQTLPSPEEKKGGTADEGSQSQDNTSALAAAGGEGRRHVTKGTGPIRLTAGGEQKGAESPTQNGR